MVSVHEFFDTCIDEIIAEFENQKDAYASAFLHDVIQRQKIENRKQRYITLALQIKAQYLSTDLMDELDDSIWQNILD